jgi:hypothetical protein
MGPDMFCDFYLVKNCRIVTNSTTTKALQNKRRFGILKILDFFAVGLAKFENNQILRNKISRRFLVTTKLCTG